MECAARSRKSCSSGGFSLIELLVVIAIIAILAAILFPILIQAKDSGKRARCTSNEKQLVSTLLVYCDDWGGRVPSVYYSDVWTNQWWQNGAAANWARALKPYAKNYAIFKCPASVVHDPNGIGSPEYSGRAKNPVSYAFNGIAVGIVANKPVGKTLSQCRHLSRTCAFREMKWYIQMAQCVPTNDGSYTMFFGYKAHLYGSNYAFFDGHVKYLKKSATPEDPNDPFWNFDDRTYVKNNPVNPGGGDNWDQDPY